MRINNAKKGLQWFNKIRESPSSCSLSSRGTEGSHDERCFLRQHSDHIKSNCHPEQEA